MEYLCHVGIFQSSSQIVLQFNDLKIQKIINLEKEDEAFIGIIMGLTEQDLFASLTLESPQLIRLDRPSIRLDKESSMVYISLMKGARHDRSIELDMFDEEIMFDFDENGKLFGMAIFNVKKYFSQDFLDTLTKERKAILVTNHNPIPPEVKVKKKKKRKKMKISSLKNLLNESIQKDQHSLMQSVMESLISSNHFTLLIPPSLIKSMVKAAMSSL